VLWLKWTALIVAAVAAVSVIGIAGLIALGTAARPKAMQSVSAEMAAVDYSDLPAPSRFPARDGTSLSYRRYNHDGDRVAVLIHGSSGESSGMHALARALHEAGFAVYVPDLRGHGNDGRLGDIDYPGQLDDDLVDLMQIVGQEHPSARVDLIGHSSGGGFVLRIAESGNGFLFARFVLLSPALHFGAPTWRPRAGGWAAAFIPRIVGLTILRRFGVTWFQHLPSVAFAVADDAPVRLAPTYSFVMQNNFAAPNHDLERLGQVGAPLFVLIGDQDEIFYADRFAPLFQAHRPGTPVTLLPGVNHMGMIVRTEALAAVVAALH
jgi:alpha-beta hydrolase superfamily lysophospholipase